jgi:hypothetical protein
LTDTNLFTWEMFTNPEVVTSLMTKLFWGRQPVISLMKIFVLFTKEILRLNSFFSKKIKATSSSHYLVFFVSQLNIRIFPSPKTHLRMIFISFHVISIGNF